MWAWDVCKWGCCALLALQSSCTWLSLASTVASQTRTALGIKAHKPRSYFSGTLAPNCVWLWVSVQEGISAQKDLLLLSTFFSAVLSNSPLMGTKNGGIGHRPFFLANKLLEGLWLTQTVSWLFESHRYEHLCVDSLERAPWKCLLWYS